MTDDPGKIPLDDRRVILDDMHNVRAWTPNLNCTEAELRLPRRPLQIPPPLASQIPPGRTFEL